MASCVVTRSFLRLSARLAAVKPCNLPIAARWRVLSSASSFNRHQVLKKAPAGGRENVGLSVAHSMRPIAVPCRNYAEGVGMTITELRDRVVKVLQLFDKIDPNKVTLESHFMKDLGLDSLDVVEIVMAFEDEFGVEIDDEQAEKIFTAGDAVEFLQTKLDMHSN